MTNTTAAQKRIGQMSAEELKALATERGFTFNAKATKSDLVKMLNGVGTTTPQAPEVPDFSNSNRNSLMKLATERGLTFTNKTTKAQFIELLKTSYAGTSTPALPFIPNNDVSDTEATVEGYMVEQNDAVDGLNAFEGRCFKKHELFHEDEATGNKFWFTPVYKKNEAGTFVTAPVTDESGNPKLHPETGLQMRMRMVTGVTFSCQLHIAGLDTMLEIRDIFAMPRGERFFVPATKIVRKPGDVVDNGATAKASANSTEVQYGHRIQATRFFKNAEGVFIPMSPMGLSIDNLMPVVWDTFMNKAKRVNKADVQASNTPASALS